MTDSHGGGICRVLPESEQMTWPNCATETRSPHFPEVSNHGASSTNDLPSSLLTAIFEPDTGEQAQRNPMTFS